MYLSISPSFPYTGSANLESYLYHPFFASLLCFISRFIRKCFPTAISIISGKPDAAFALALEFAPFRLFVYFDPLYSLGRSDPIYHISRRSYFIKISNVFFYILFYVFPVNRPFPFKADIIYHYNIIPINIPNN